MSAIRTSPFESQPSVVYFLGSLSTLFCSTVLCLALFTQAAVAQEDIEDNSYLGKLGRITAVIVENNPDAPWIVYLHGWAGSGESTYEEFLKGEIQKSESLRNVNWIIPSSPRGSWFFIETDDFRIWQDTLVPTRIALEQMIKKAKINPRKIIWAGFSQGAITATDYVLHAKVPPLGLIVNSGVFFDSTDWRRSNRHLKGVKFFMTHDPTDSTLPYKEARKLERLLKDKGMVGHLERISLGHVVPSGFLEKVVNRVAPQKRRLAPRCSKILE